MSRAPRLLFVCSSQRVRMRSIFILCNIRSRKCACVFQFFMAIAHGTWSSHIRRSVKRVKTEEEREREKFDAHTMSSQLSENVGHGQIIIFPPYANTSRVNRTPIYGDLMPFSPQFSASSPIITIISHKNAQFSVARNVITMNISRKSADDKWAQSLVQHKITMSICGKIYFEKRKNKKK